VYQWRMDLPGKLEHLKTMRFSRGFTLKMEAIFSSETSLPFYLNDHVIFAKIVPKRGTSANLESHEALGEFHSHRDHSYDTRCMEYPSNGKTIDFPHIKSLTASEIATQKRLSIVRD
jgi:hypothetical protein